MFRVYRLKLQKPDIRYFNRLFAEAKWQTNAMIEAPDLKAFDTRVRTVTVKRGDHFEVEPYTFLSAQMRQQLQQRMWDNLKGLKTRKAKGDRVGRLNFRAFINSIPLFNQSFSVHGNRIKLQSCQLFAVRAARNAQVPARSLAPRLSWNQFC